MEPYINKTSIAIATLVTFLSMAAAMHKNPTYPKIAPDTPTCTVEERPNAQTIRPLMTQIATLSNKKCAVPRVPLMTAAVTKKGIEFAPK